MFFPMFLSNGFHLSLFEGQQMSSLQEFDDGQGLRQVLPASGSVETQSGHLAVAQATGRNHK